jgi:mono/diheme cytochrome c family protein
MDIRRPGGWKLLAGAAVLAPVLATFAATGSPTLAQALAPSQSATFTKDIAPILQRSCQQCHRPDGVAPMSLVTYEEARPWARAIRTRTSIGPKAGVMPPWYIEKNIGIQHYKDDPSLSDDEIAKIGRWVDAGAPMGNAADMPRARQFDDASIWRIGKPDMIVSTEELLVKANAADWWGIADPIPMNELTEDRYVSAVEIKEVNDVPSHRSGRQTVGGRYVVHHLSWSTRMPTAMPGSRGGAAPDDDSVTPWPTHEVGRNPDYFDPRAGRLLKAGSNIVVETFHLHSNGSDTRARLEIGFKFHPKGYEPEYKRSRVSLGNGLDIDIQPNQGNQQLHAYAITEEPTKIITFEPHLHAPGARMCIEAIWGINIQTLSCAGYDHNWVRGYAFQDDYAPLLPKGTILHIVGYMDSTPANKNIADPRNWSGSGNRSVANMFIDLGIRVSLTEEQFQNEMAERRQKLNLTANDVLIGCPLCNAVPKPGYKPAPAKTTTAGGQ